jgi:hypothetical protein
MKKKAKSSADCRVLLIIRFYKAILFYIKGIVQPFELGGETRLIQSAVKYYR